MSIIIWLYVLGILMLRPTFLGETFTVVGLILVLCAGIIYLIINKGYIEINKKLIPWIVVFLLFWIYLLFLALFFQDDGIEFLIKSIISNILVIIVSIILFSNNIIFNKIIKIVSMILFILSASYCITLFLSLLIPIDKMFITKIYSNTYKNSGFIYFPITPIYSFMTIPGGVRLPRFLSIFREAGIAPAFLIWLLIMILNKRIIILKNKRIVKYILIISIIGTFSTSGIVILVLTLILRFLNKYKNKRMFLNIVLSMIFLLAGLYLAFEAPYIGINKKIVTHRESITDRSFAIKNGVEKLIDNPMGVGLYGDSKVGTNAINLIAGSYQLGILGVLFLIGIYFIPLLNNKNIKYFESISPIFLTLLLSQPIVDAPFVFIILLASIKISDNNFNVIN